MLNRWNDWNASQWQHDTNETKRDAYLDVYVIFLNHLLNQLEHEYFQLTYFFALFSKPFELWTLHHISCGREISKTNVNFPTKSCWVQKQIHTCNTNNSYGICNCFLILEQAFLMNMCFIVFGFMWNATENSYIAFFDYIFYLLIKQKEIF